MRWSTSSTSCSIASSRLCGASVSRSSSNSRRRRARGVRSSWEMPAIISFSALSIWSMRSAIALKARATSSSSRPPLTGIRWDSSPRAMCCIASTVAWSGRVIRTATSEDSRMITPARTASTTAARSVGASTSRSRRMIAQPSASSRRTATGARGPRHRMSSRPLCSWGRQSMLRIPRRPKRGGCPRSMMSRPRRLPSASGSAPPSSSAATYTDWSRCSSSTRLAKGSRTARRVSTHATLSVAATTRARSRARRTRTLIRGPWGSCSRSPAPSSRSAAAWGRRRAFGGCGSRARRRSARRTRSPRRGRAP